MSKMMAPFVLKGMRSLVEAMLVRVRDAQALQRAQQEPADYRLEDLETGLWQATQALGWLIRGQVEPGRKAIRQMEGPRVPGPRAEAE